MLNGKLIASLFAKLKPGPTKRTPDLVDGLMHETLWECYVVNMKAKMQKQRNEWLFTD